MDYAIRMLNANELQEALHLVWNVFLEFEAPEYSAGGINEFRAFIDPDTVRKKVENNEFRIWGCFIEKKVVGVIASRPPCHISLLFVDKQFHRKGIAKALFNELISYYRSFTEYTEVTVHSSPYAVDTYHHMGFVDTTAEQEINGIRFVPMKRSLEC
ncbi:MAG: GCN5-related N-acetyltransferase [Paenibacillaceae bacterium]|jgi:GNAT superfamily N-acetyltransferase|nr:GCN5-related N-acetyltransferase [Paenibacillaceae bacterium]